MAIEKSMMPPGEEEVETTEETVSIPVSLLAGKSVAPGDVVRLEVVSLDDEGGNVVVKYATEAPAPETVGAESMAAEFD